MALQADFVKGSLRTKYRDKSSAQMHWIHSPYSVLTGQGRFPPYQVLVLFILPDIPLM